MVLSHRYDRQRPRRRSRTPLEIRRRRQDDERAEANQARLVTVRSDRWTGRDETNAPAAHLIIHNHSEAPVHHVDAGPLIADPIGRHTIRVLGNLTCSQQLYVLEPSGERDAYYWPDRQPIEDPHAVTWITFVDARGQKWGRIDNGEPRKLQRQPTTSSLWPGSVQM
ncbi:hypothetical protein [Hamadaea tsunoensis]|uniref:hypothetical protein n=1 Tax=Hamadaea tsunoensis TaxID=53368 RepID=UPI0012F8307C|nr:hypothetical protein [Hamadaea tsunoensis]